MAKFYNSQFDYWQNGMHSNISSSSPSLQYPIGTTIKASFKLVEQERSVGESARDWYTVKEQVWVRMDNSPITVTNTNSSSSSSSISSVASLIPIPSSLPISKSNTPTYTFDSQLDYWQNGRHSNIFSSSPPIQHSVGSIKTVSFKLVEQERSVGESARDWYTVKEQVWVPIEENSNLITLTNTNSSSSSSSISSSNSETVISPSTTSTTSSSTAPVTEPQSVPIESILAALDGGTPINETNPDVSSLFTNPNPDVDNLSINLSTEQLNDLLGNFSGF